jgi:hypothetical protein
MESIHAEPSHSLNVTFVRIIIECSIEKQITKPIVFNQPRELQSAQALFTQ